MRKSGMKRCLWPLGLVCVLLLSAARASAPSAVQESSVPVIIDKQLSGAALVRNGEAFVSLRSVAKALGLKVQYNADAQIIIIDTPSARHQGASPTLQ